MYADIEDLFEPLFYLKLFNGAFEGEFEREISMDDIKGYQEPRIVKKIENFIRDEFGCLNGFNHFKPAEYLMTYRIGLKSEICASVMDRFELLFKRINDLICET